MNTSSVTRLCPHLMPQDLMPQDLPDSYGRGYGEQAHPEAIGPPCEDDFSSYLYQLKLLLQEGFYIFCRPRKPRKRLTVEATHEFSAIIAE